MYQTHHHKEILTLFQEHPEQRYTGMSILNIFKDTINKATIYRKLKNLEEQRIIRKNFNPLKKCYEYQYALKCENHLHLVCKHCGKILHLTCTEANSFISHISIEHAFEIDKEFTNIFGLCKECKAYA